jgi:hypothetical protein
LTSYERLFITSLAGKGESNERLTYLLRPNVRNPDYGVISALETPPATDADYSSQIETSDVDSELISDRELIESDLEEPVSNPRPLTTIPGDTLYSIQEVSIPSSPRLAVHESKDDDEWSALSGDDAFGDESSSEAGQDLIDSVADLSLEDNLGQGPPSAQKHESQEQDPDKTLTKCSTDVIREIAVEDSIRSSHRSHLSGRHWIRCTSSPSRSPVRPRRFTSARKDRRAAANFRATSRRNYNTFYDYLFA